MWSRVDPATGRYALLRSVGGGAPTPVAVAQRAGGPFDNWSGYLNQRRAIVASRRSLDGFAELA